MFSRYTNYGDLDIPAETTYIMGVYTSIHM